MKNQSKTSTDYIRKLTSPVVRNYNKLSCFVELNLNYFFLPIYENYFGFDFFKFVTSSKVYVNTDLNLRVIQNKNAKFKFKSDPPKDEKSKVSCSKHNILSIRMHGTIEL
uniref:Uncharacterized protein n=1 Tax=Trichogramma kaykai TaxID=54128 RepID=A0ABD2WYH3_9HYME